MKAASAKEIKQNLEFNSKEELINLCLRLSKFKKENKELLSYLLFEESNEANYIENVKEEIDENFDTINTKSFHFIKKSVRKILRIVKKYIRYSQNKETEVELMIYYCFKLKNMSPSIYKDKTLLNIYQRQIDFTKKKISALHEDLQFDFFRELEDLEA